MMYRIDKVASDGQNDTATYFGPDVSADVVSANELLNARLESGEEPTALGEIVSLSARVAIVLGKDDSVIVCRVFDD